MCAIQDSLIIRFHSDFVKDLGDMCDSLMIFPKILKTCALIQNVVLTYARVCRGLTPPFDKWKPVPLA